MVDLKVWIGEHGGKSRVRQQIGLGGHLGISCAQEDRADRSKGKEINKGTRD